jgi:hypothetical protein
MMGLQTKPKSYKYEIECLHFKETIPDSGFLNVWDLWSEGDTLSELLDNATLWNGYRKKEAEDNACEVYITAEFLRLQSEERK